MHLIAYGIRRRASLVQLVRPLDWKEYETPTALNQLRNGLKVNVGEMSIFVGSKSAPMWQANGVLVFRMPIS